MNNQVKQHVLTANRLIDGVVVYFQAASQWTEDLADASVYADRFELEQALALAKKDAQARLVIGIYEIEVLAMGQELMPQSAKEMIRARHKPTLGPSA